MTDSDVRLLGAGRLAIEVPVGWPVRSGLFVVRRSTVVLPEAITPAMHVWSPIEGAVSITLDHFPPLPFGQSFRRAGSEARTVALPSGDEMVWSESVRWSVNRADSHTSLVLSAPTLGGQFTIAGPEADVHAVAATARLVPDGFVAVPNVLVGVRQTDPSEPYEPPAERQARTMIEAAGLGFEARFPLKPGGGKRKRVALSGTDPSGGSVVPVGTTVVAEFVRVH